MPGPLSGLTILELGGIGPAPFAGMMFADHGADVIVIDRKGAGPDPFLKVDVNRRGKRAVALNLKDPEDVALLMRMVRRADAVFEGFRPGVLEKLGIGPDALLAANPKLVIGRMTGWGQTGPYAHTAGHDINYIALTGALHAIGGKSAPPPPPLNLLGDYGGGAMMLAFGMLAALLDAKATGKGQVVDAAMTDGTAALLSLFSSLSASEVWTDARESNFLDGGAHFYGTYETSDGGFMSVGAIEPQFMMLFLEKMGLSSDWMEHHLDKTEWPRLKTELAALFKTKTRDEWAAIFDGTDACVAPVLSLKEAPTHPQNADRDAYITLDGVTQPSPAPRFSRTPSGPPERIPGPDADGDTLRREFAGD